MSQITLYLDDATQALVDQAAQAHGLSKSRWVADIIRKHPGHEWPQDCLALAGGFADFPLRELLREQSPASLPADVPRRPPVFASIWRLWARPLARTTR